MAMTGICQAELDPAGRRIVYAKGRSVFLRELSGGPDRLVGTHDQPLDEKGPECLALAPSGDRVASIDRSREVRIWSLRRRRGRRPARAQGDGQPRGPVAGPLRPERLAPGLGVVRRPRRVPVGCGGAPGCSAGPAASPGRTDAEVERVHPQWRVAGGDGRILRDVLAGRRPPPLRAARPHARARLATSRSPPTRGGWPRGRSTGRGSGPSASRGASGYPNDRVQEGWIYGARRPLRRVRAVLVSGAAGDVNLVPIGGGPVRNLLGNTWASARDVTGAVGFDPTGRRVAWASGYAPDPADKVLRVWDLRVGEGMGVALLPGLRQVETLRPGHLLPPLRARRFALCRWARGRPPLERGDGREPARPGGAVRRVSTPAVMVTSCSSRPVRWCLEGIELRQVRAQLMDLRDGTSRPITGRGDF